MCEERPAEWGGKGEERQRTGGIDKVGLVLSQCHAERQVEMLLLQNREMHLQPAACSGKV